MVSSYQSKFESIVDGLANKGFAVADQFLTEQEVNHILALDEFSDGLLRFQKAGIGKHTDKQINESIRGDHIKWIDRNTAPSSLQIYLDRLSELMRMVNQELFLSLRDYEVHMTIYPAGTFYKRHLDQFKADDHRKLSLICYLNNDWIATEGGQLRMHLPDGPIDFLPIAGRLVCFRSDLVEHEVLPASRARMSITGWLLDREQTLMNW